MNEPDLLAALKRLHETMTPGPWLAMDYTHSPTGSLGIASDELEAFIASPGAMLDEDAAGIAELRNLLPALTEALERADYADAMLVEVYFGTVSVIILAAKLEN